MIKRFSKIMAVLLFTTSAAAAQDANGVLESASRAMGATNLRTIEYSGTGSDSALGIGQNYRPEDPWPSFNAKSYVYAANYATPAAREEIVSTQANPVRGGGFQPIVGERRQVQFVDGLFAWDLNVAANTPVPQPGAAWNRLVQLWMTPQGFLIGARKNNAFAAGSVEVKQQTINGKKYNVVSYSDSTIDHSNNSQMIGYINEQNLIERVETLVDSPVLGDMLVEVEYSDYRDFGGLQFPGRIVQKQGGYPVLDITVSDVKPNVPIDISVPDTVRKPPPLPPARIDSQKVAEGVYFLTGSLIGSVAVEFKDFIVVVETPENERRSSSVIGELNRLIPNKPIRYAVNTHHHFDHSGGIRTYVAEGATILTQEGNKAFWEQTLNLPRTMHPDKLSVMQTTPHVEGVKEKRVITDGTRSLELYHLEGNRNAEYMLIAYLPAEKLLIESDAFSAPAAGVTPRNPPNPDWLNLYDNIERLGLDVKQIVSVDGRFPVPMDEFLTDIGKGP